MLAVSRRNAVMELLTEKKNVTVIELAKLFDVTDGTTRSFGQNTWWRFYSGRCHK
ncbi:MAG: hypothetical protein RSD42_02935 [Oscillospiraceae bacterium]